MKYLLLPALFAFSLLPCSHAEEETKVTLADAKAEFAKADKALNLAYSEAKTVLEEPEFATLQKNQRQWVEWRDHLVIAQINQEAEEDSRLSPEAVKKTPEYLTASAELTRDRVLWIKGLIAVDDSETLTGIWQDSYGGEIEIVQEEGTMYFVCNAVRSAASDVGWLAGIGRWNARQGWFTDKGRNKEKVEETSLVFVWHERVLEVFGANTEYYHGQRAYFEGRYVKTGDLDKKQYAEVIHTATTGEMPEDKEN